MEWGEQQEVWKFELRERVEGVGAERTELGHNRVDLKQSSFIYLPFISKAALIRGNQTVSQSANSCVTLWLALLLSRHVSRTCCVSSKRPKRCTQVCSGLHQEQGGGTSAGDDDDGMMKDR